MGWGVGVGKLGDECTVNGGDGESVLSKPFLENIDRRNRNDGVRQMMYDVHGVHQQSVPLIIASTCF